MTMLDQILETKRAEVAERRREVSTAELGAQALTRTPPRGFRAALEAKPGYALIAEIKKASPSKGLIRADFDPPAHARAYEAGGAACLSVLTDAPYFHGSPDYLIAARAACTLPVLRKDFMVDPWQCLEARAMGADAILIIVAALDDEAMAEIEVAALELGMDVLVEVHDPEELDRALNLRSRLIGVNNRDLRNFSVDFQRTYELVDRAPADCTFVAESGLTTRADLDAMAGHGVRCFLIGEALMRQDDIEAATRALVQNPSPLGREFRVGPAPGRPSTARGAVDPKLDPLGAAEWEGEGDASPSPSPFRRSAAPSLSRWERDQ